MVRMILTDMAAALCASLGTPSNGLELGFRLIEAFLDVRVVLQGSGVSIRGFAGASRVHFRQRVWI